MLTTQANAGPRVYASAPGSLGSHVIAGWCRPGSARRRRMAQRYSSNMELGSPVWACTVRSFHSGGWGSHGAAASGGLKPNGGSSPLHGSGTRQPSRLWPLRAHIGS
jgi:hypothetical protein